MINTKKIFVVNDAQHICELLHIYLKNEGYNVVFAYDGSDAVNKAKEEKPDLIVLDVMMPIINGWEACKLIRQFTKRYCSDEILIFSSEQFLSN